MPLTEKVIHFVTPTSSNVLVMIAPLGHAAGGARRISTVVMDVMAAVGKSLNIIVTLHVCAMTASQKGTTPRTAQRHNHAIRQSMLRH